jgi:hypothetical protein
MDGWIRGLRIKIKTIFCDRSHKDETKPARRPCATTRKQLSQVVENLAAMYGDIQGASGNALQAIPSLELPA